MMKKISLVLALVISAIVSTAQTWTNVNGRWGYEWLRTTKALFMPSGNGAPSGTASLNGAGYKGQAAIYSDTTAKKLYMFNPKDSTWTDITAGGSGSVTSVSGTVNRITITNPTTTPVIDIASSYIGQASITLLGTISTGVWNGTAIGPIYGGTGQTTVTTGDLLYGSASNTWAKLPGVATGNALISGGVGTAFAWGKIGLSTHVTGNLPVTNLGSGAGASNTTFWRGDGTWATPAGGGGGAPSLAYKYNAFGGIGGVQSPGEAAYQYDSITNKLTVDSIRSIKNIPDTVHIGLFERNKADTAVFFGTSITAGTDASVAQNRYVNIVAAWLRCGLINGGLGGYLLQKSPGWPLTNTFKDAYATVIPDKRAGLRYLFFAWGENDATNDQSYHALFGVDTAYFKRDYVIVINYALAHGWSLSDIIIISPFYQLTSSASLALQQNYSDASKHVADSMGIKWVDVFTQGKNYNTLILNDYIHPSNYGHALHADAIIKQLTQLMQIDDGDNLVNAGTTVLNDVKFYGKDTATAGYQLGGFNPDGKMVRVPSERYLLTDNTNIPVQSGNASIRGNVNAGLALRAMGYPSFTTGAGLEIYYSGGDGFLFPFNRDASTSGNMYVPFGKFTVGSPGVAPFTKFYVTGTGFAEGLYSANGGDVLYNTTLNKTTLNMLVSGDSVGHITTYGPNGGSPDYYRTAINGTSTKPVVINTLADNGSGARLQVNGPASVADDAYDATTWNGNVTVPTKNAIRDKIESMTGGSSSFLNKQYTTTQNSGTSQTDLYTYTIPANTLTTDGDIIDVESAGFYTDATATMDLQLMLNGSSIEGTSPLTLAGTAHWSVTSRIIRTSSSTARSTTTFSVGDGTGREYTGNATVSSLDFTSGIIIKITGTAGGAGGSTGDILGHLWTVEFKR